MQNKTFRNLWVTLLIVGGLLQMAGCTDLNLKDVDATTELDLSLALPVGSMSVKLGDFLNADSIEHLYVREDGTYFYQNIVNIVQKNFHVIDLGSYFIRNNAPTTFVLYDALQSIGLPAIGGTIPIVGDGVQQLTLSFPMYLALEGFNVDMSQERIDSIAVTTARFVSSVTINNVDLRWSEIKDIRVILGDRFYRPQGNICTLPIAGKGFGQDLTITLDDFFMTCLRDRNDINKGIVDTLSFNIDFDIVLDPGHAVTIDPYASISYDMHVDLLDFAAVWGYFEGENQVRDDGAISISDFWKELSELQNISLKVAEPKVVVYVTHQVAAPLKLDINYVCVNKTNNAERHYATWNGEQSTSLSLPEVLDIKSDYEDSVQNNLQISYREDEGNLDYLFDYLPDSLIYSFAMMLDPSRLTEYPQQRMVNQTYIHSYADVTVPFVFNEGSHFEYTMLKEDVAISSVSIDSLIEDINGLEQINKADVRLVLEVANSIPFGVSLDLEFLKADGTDAGIKLLAEGDKLLIPAPDKENMVNGKVTHPKNATFTLEMSKDDLSKMSEVKKIRMNAALTQNQAQANLTSDTKLKIGIGIAANMDAVIDLSKFLQIENEKND